ncbi:MAG: glycosyltransferase family 2 protein [Parcubacteria group bacterium]|nr:glycosyltransferase family 2 protein [Parcubacteria group bacterium]
MFLSIIIVNYNTKDQLRACLESIKKYGIDDLETIVVDNASVDESVAMARYEFSWARVIANESNLGFAGGCNKGARESSGKYLLFLNPDVELKKDTVKILIDFLETNHRAGACGPKFTHQGKIQYGYYLKLPSLIQFIAFVAYIPFKYFLYFLHLKKYWMELDLASTHSVEHIPGSCLMVRKSAFESLRGFDENFWPIWFEDVDFARRLRDAGYYLYYVAEAEIEHQGGGSIARLPSATTRPWYYSNCVRYFKKHRPLYEYLFVSLCVKGYLIINAKLKNQNGK